MEMFNEDAGLAYIHLAFCFYLFIIHEIFSLNSVLILQALAARYLTQFFLQFSAESMLIPVNRLHFAKLKIVCTISLKLNKLMGIFIMTSTSS